MKSRVMLSLFGALLAMVVIASTQNAGAAEVSYTPPSDGSHEYMHHSYHTPDPVFSTWYPSEGQSYAYPGRSTQAGRSASNYVFTSPTNAFDTWTGNGRSAKSVGNAGGYSSGASGNGRGTGR